MILGTIIEITDGSNPKEKFYVIQNRQIIDEDYIENNKIFNYFEFKNRMKRREALSFQKMGLLEKPERRRTICRDILKT